MSDDTLKLIQDIFLAEAAELLQMAEAEFLSLEKPMDHKNTFANLKRVAHNFKGSSRSVGFDDAAQFCHHLENLIIALGDGKIALEHDVVQLLIDCNDRLKNVVERLSQDRSARIHSDDLIEAINRAINGSKQFDLATVNQELETSGFCMFDDEPPPQEAQLTSPITKINRNELVTRDSSVSQNEGKNTSTGANEESIRIPMKKVDDMLDAFGEQVILISSLEHYIGNYSLYVDELNRTIFNLKKLAFDIQQSTLSLRMVTLKTLFAKLKRAIRDAGKTTGKEVNCHFVGEDEELDKIIVDQLSDPLNHMVRNAVDHGIESAEDRLALGKPATGMIFIRAKREGGSFVILIEDDGKGMSPDYIRKKAIEKGLIAAYDNRSDKDIFELIFENGFSTKENVSELSGRGVGMNVVKEAIISMKGSYTLDSILGKGTQFKIKLPLSLSLFNGILFEYCGNRYLVPSAQVSEIVELSSVETRKTSGGKKIIQVRDHVLDLIDLSKYLGVGKNSKDMEVKDRHRRIIIAEVPGRRIGFLVDAIISIQRVVQKPLSREMAVCPGAVGVTILGDGVPAIILDLKLLQETISGTKPSKTENRANAA